MTLLILGFFTCLGAKLVALCIDNSIFTTLGKAQLFKKKVDKNAVPKAAGLFKKQLMDTSRSIENLCLDNQDNHISSMKTIKAKEEVDSGNSREVNSTARQRYLEALVQVERFLLTFDGNTQYYGDILQTLGEACKASRVYVCENHRSDMGELLMSQKAEWCTNSLRLQNVNQSWELRNISYEEFFPRRIESLANGEAFFGVVADFPESERKILVPRGVL